MITKYSVRVDMEKEIRAKKKRARKEQLKGAPIPVFANKEQLSLWASANEIRIPRNIRSSGTRAVYKYLINHRVKTAPNRATKDWLAITTFCDFVIDQGVAPSLVYPMWSNCLLNCVPVNYWAENAKALKVREGEITNLARRSIAVLESQFGDDERYTEGDKLIQVNFTKELLENRIK